jgi:hypothetical protein
MAVSSPLTSRPTVAALLALTAVTGLGSVAAMLAGAAAGAGIVQWSPAAALAVVGALVAAVAGAFLTAVPARAREVAPRPLPA